MQTKTKPSSTQYPTRKTSFFWGKKSVGEVFRQKKGTNLVVVQKNCLQSTWAVTAFNPPGYLLYIVGNTTHIYIYI